MRFPLNPQKVKIFTGGPRGKGKKDSSAGLFFLLILPRSQTHRPQRLGRAEATSVLTVEL